MRRSQLGILLIILLALALAACREIEQTQEPEPEPEAEETLQAEPTEEATPTATRRPTSVPPTPRPTATPEPYAPADREAVLEAIAGVPDGRFLVGQWGLFGDGNTPESADERLETIEQETGRYPAMTGADFGALSASMQEVTDWLIDKHREGYIVAASYHMENPVTGAWVDDIDLEGQTLCDIPENENYQEAVDELAGYLQQLDEAGVVLLWRPFHEMNGNWFWWGYENHDRCFDDLWRDLYERLEEDHGLDNLLWVYSPNAPMNSSHRRHLMSGYPGDEYVDIVGLDKYGAGIEEQLDLDIGYERLVETGKPFMLNEFGGRDSNPEDLVTAYSLSDQLLPDIVEHYPKIKGVMFWEWVWALDHSDYTEQRDFMADRVVLDRGDMPWARP